MKHFHLRLILLIPAPLFTWPNVRTVTANLRNAIWTNVALHIKLNNNIVLFLTQGPLFSVTKDPAAAEVESLLERKLAWTCSTTHPNRRVPIHSPLSSTSSEAAHLFVLTIHKRPFKWRDSVISEILAPGLCEIEKRGERRREKIHPWPINSNYLSASFFFLSCQCYLGKRGDQEKGPIPHVICTKGKGRPVPPPTPTQLWYGEWFCFFALVWAIPFKKKKKEEIAMHCITPKLNLDSQR